jgi:hypothetical protein
MCNTICFFFTLQQWLHAHASLLRYTYILPRYQHKLAGIFQCISIRKKVKGKVTPKKTYVALRGPGC